MPIITRFGGSGGGTPVVDPYPHVWECTVVQSGTTGVVSGVVTLETYDILHYTMPLGFSTYDLMIGGVVYTTSFRNEGEMYIQWDGNDFSVVSANASCGLSHVWTSPTYTITGSVLTITGGVDDLHTNDVIELTLASGESASVIEYDSNTYTIDVGISAGVNYVKFNGTSFENGLFNFKGDATASDVVSGKTFYSNSGTLLTGEGSLASKLFEKFEIGTPTMSGSSAVIRFRNFDANRTIIGIGIQGSGDAQILYSAYNSMTVQQDGDDIVVTVTNAGTIYSSGYLQNIVAYEVYAKYVQTPSNVSTSITQTTMGRYSLRTLGIEVTGASVGYWLTLYSTSFIQSGNTVETASTLKYNNYGFPHSSKVIGQAQSGVYMNYYLCTSRLLLKEEAEEAFAI